MATGGAPPAFPNLGARRDPAPSGASPGPPITIATRRRGRGPGVVCGWGRDGGEWWAAGIEEGRRQECRECRAVDLGFLWVRGGGLVAAGGAGLCCEGAGAAGRAPGRAEVGGGSGLRVGRQQGAAAARWAQTSPGWAPSSEGGRERTFLTLGPDPRCRPGRGFRVTLHARERTGLCRVPGPLAPGCSSSPCARCRS